ncbi:I78 family peptidase inhibitor [Acidovorax carolinensis]|nr:I78 family peptidase inhibitor [Acidovorax carolinensis]
MQMPRTHTLTASLTTCLCAALLAGCAGLPGGTGGAGATGGAAPASVGPGPRGGVCNAAPAQGVIGKQGTPSVIEQARVASGAAMARLLHPRQAVTLEFNTERLNLVVDANGRITAVRCG